MKTFKLIKLNVLEGQDDEFQRKSIPLIDGLIINREDEENKWLIEAYLESRFKDYFQPYFESEQDIVLQAKITKSSNKPAMFLVKAIDINDIGDDCNVLFIGTILDYQKDQAERLLKSLLDKGLEGEELLAAFKDTVETTST
ncbi:YwpF family protein [Pontibacillus salicampi]|uniref:YwpF family protein n=1 Tax=Pontibacillus salicampi TaxID=1449801 RepID=A0ABV6LIH8_9BACI